MADTGKREACVRRHPRPCSSPLSSATLPSTPSLPLAPPPSPAGTVPGEHSPWGKLPGLLFRGQGETPQQRALGAGARSRGHTRAIVQQLGWYRLRLYSDHHFSAPPPTHTGVRTWHFNIPALRGSHSQAGRAPAHSWHRAADASRGMGTKWRRP